MRIRAVLWDVDDTLFDYSGADHAGTLNHLEAEGLLTRFDTPEQAVDLWRAVMETQYARFAAGEIGFQEQRRERVRAFLGEPFGDAEADGWFGRYLDHFERAWALFPDAVPVLDALTPRYRHGVLSNSSVAMQERKLRVLGVRERFECLVCSDELGYAKPDPRAFLAACEELRLPPGQVAYVGDRQDVDARAADEAGLFGVWLDRTGTGAAQAGGLRRIVSLTELTRIL